VQYFRPHSILRYFLIYVCNEKMLKKISMKKLLFVAFLLIVCLGCNNTENEIKSETINPNSAQAISSSKGMTYNVKITVGHSASGCSGCFMVGGILQHINCQGPGNDCQINARMEITDSGEINFYDGIISNGEELTADDFFVMPNRSLYIIGTNGEFLNIPEQIVYRDEDTGTFIFYDIFFSDAQMFENK